VVGSALGSKVERLCIDNDDGRTLMSQPHHLPLTDQIAIWMAGQEATRILAIDAPTRLADRDREAILKLILKLIGDVPAAEHSRLRALGGERAEPIINRHSAALVAVADRLEADGQLDGTTFYYILRTCVIAPDQRL
jgi:hypothetical protein